MVAPRPHDSLPNASPSLEIRAYTTTRPTRAPDARRSAKMSPHEHAAQDPQPLVELTYYTDPLCPWSWAMEPHWRRLRFEFGGRIAWRYVMGGMVKDWRSYRDEINSVHRPSQMG